ncbi:MAG: OmpA family protein [Bacteroidota bacterium]|nr:OmpA family protein [Bacteroidota bacterium]
MVHKKLIFVLLFIYFNITNAQLTANKFRVKFNVDEYLIDAEDKQVLDEILKDAKGEKYYELTLEAHTDNDANDTYNMNLSRRRAQSVYSYLVENGINEKMMDINWYGERKPENQNRTEEGKAYNRRVEIELRKYVFEEISEVLKAAGGDYTQCFSLNSINENIIVGTEGTKITIPQNAFETKGGKPISNEKVEIKLAEFQKPMDAVSITFQLYAKEKF